MRYCVGRRSGWSIADYLKSILAVTDLQQQDIMTIEASNFNHSGHTNVFIPQRTHAVREREREREIHYVHWASKAYGDESVFTKCTVANISGLY